MPPLCPSRLHSLWYQSRYSTLSLPSLSTNLSDAKFSQRSSFQRTGSQTLPRRNGDESHRQGAWRALKEKSLAGWLNPLKSYYNADQRYRPVPSLKLANFALSSPKNSKYQIWGAVDSCFVRVLGFVCGSRTITTGSVLSKQIKYLPTMGYSTDWL